MKNNIVITGVLGYIGFNLLVTLLRLGYNVVGVDRNAENGQVKRYFDTTGFQCCGNFSFFKADLSIMAETQDFITWCKQQKIKAHTIINLSADKSIPESIINPTKTVGNNLLTTYSAITISHALQCRSFIQASSITELDCRGHWNPYSWSKRLSDGILRTESMFDDTYYKSVIITNPFGSLAGVESKGNAFEQAVRSAMFEDKTLSLSVDNHGVCDTVYKRNFISMFELITIFLHTITQYEQSHIPQYIKGGVINPNNEWSNYSITQFADYCCSQKQFNIEYVNDKNLSTSYKSVTTFYPLDSNTAYEQFINMLSDMPSILFKPPVYFSAEQKKNLAELRHIFIKQKDQIHRQQKRFEILYKMLLL